RDERDDEVGGGQAALQPGHRFASTMILPAIVWWATPQYSWQMMGYSPGVLKRAWAWEICPGSSITLTLWRGNRGPCPQDVLVAQKGTVAPAGTRHSLGANGQTRP